MRPDSPFDRRRATHAGRRRASLALASLLLILPLRAAEESLPNIDDLRPLAAEVQRDGRPLLLFFTTPGCPYCLEVRRSYLRPRVREGSRDALIREVDITSRREIVGLGGERLTEAQLAARFDVRVVPVVLLVDARLKPLGEPLVGLSASGFYEAYLAAGIEQARRALRQR